MSKKILETIYVVVEPSKTMKIMKDGEARTFQRPVFELVVLLKENWLKSGWTNGSKRPVINIYMIINALICK